MNAASDKNQARKSRLKDNLRANLQKRKHQARERTKSTVPDARNSKADQAKD